MIHVAAVPLESGAPAWSVRLAADLDANDQGAKKLVAELTEEQLNWQPAPGSWSVGQCLEHLCIANEVYLPAHIGASVLERFLAGNESCRELMVRTRAKNVNRISFGNPLFPGIRYTIGTGLQIIVGHERRHILQAERVLHSPGFPHKFT